MPRNITVTFGDGTSHTYQNAPDDVTPDAVQARAEKEFSKSVTSLDGGRGTAPAAPKLTGVDAIPGQRSIAKSEPEPSMLDKIRGGLEVLPAMAGGAVGGVVAPIAQLGHELFGGQAFTPQGKKAAAEFGKKVQAEFYQPRTATGQQYTEAVGNALAPTVGIMPMTGLMGDIGRSAGPATRALADVGRAEGDLVKGAVAAPFEARAAVKQAKNVAESYKNATVIDATNAAQRIGAAVNPAKSNPTAGNRFKGAVAGVSNVEGEMAKNNIAAVTDTVRQDLGVPAEGRLDRAAVDSALDVASKPYDVVRAIPTMSPSGEVLASIRALDLPATIGGKAKAATVKALIGDTIDELTAGRSGAQVVDDVRQLRRDAQSVYKARDKGNNPPVADVAAADARMGIADALERMIDEHAPNPQVLGDFQKARQRMAQIFDHERALDYGQEKIDPQAYAKMYQERKGNMTGVGSDIGKAASVFPSEFALSPIAEGALPRLSRAGIAGATGAAIGSLGGPVGAAAGLAAGTGIGALAGKIAAKRMATPAYQAAHAVPTDYRPPVNNLRPAEMNYGANQMVPYDWSQQVITPDQIPNWVPGRGEVPPARVTPTGVAPGPAQIGMSQGPVGGQTGALRAEDARLYQQQAAAEAAAQAAAAPPAVKVTDIRKSTGVAPNSRGGIQFDLDPVTGELVPTSSTLRRATPDINVIESTGHSMTSAVDKITKGQLFALTPEERISWNKTKVDVAQVLPELQGLTDKAIASKMADRKWIADTITKLREQDQAFNMLAERSKTTQHMLDATKKREILLDQLIALEERLRPPRPVSSGNQGPKTRAANRLIVTPENINSLRD
jgi:hypothetical protein